MDVYVRHTKQPPHMSSSASHSSQLPAELLEVDLPTLLDYGLFEGGLGSMVIVAKEPAVTELVESIPTASREHFP